MTVRKAVLSHILHIARCLEAAVHVAALGVVPPGVPRAIIITIIIIIIMITITIRMIIIISYIHSVAIFISH